MNRLDKGGLDEAAISDAALVRQVKEATAAWNRLAKAHRQELITALASCSMSTESSKDGRACAPNLADQMLPASRTALARTKASHSLWSILADVASPQIEAHIRDCPFCSPQAATFVPCIAARIGELAAADSAAEFPHSADLQSASKGDQAWATLEERHSARVEATIKKVLGREDCVKEELQETFIKAFSSLHTHDVKKSFPGWVSSIGWRGAIDHWRRRASTNRTAYPPCCGRLPAVDGDEGRPAADPTGDPISEKAIRALHECMAVLEPKTAGVLWLKYFADWSYSQIAATVDRSRAWVCDQHAKGLTILTRCLRSKGIDDDQL